MVEERLRGKKAEKSGVPGGKCFLVLLAAVCLVLGSAAGVKAAQISYTKISAPARIHEIMSTGGGRSFSFTKEIGANETIDYSVQIDEAGVFGLVHVDNGWASNVVGLYKDSAGTEVVEKRRGGANTWYVKPGTYYFSVYYAARTHAVTHEWCAFLFPESMAGTVTQKLSSDKKSCTITLSAYDMEHLSRADWVKGATDIAGFSTFSSEESGIVWVQNDGPSFTVTKNGVYTVMLPWYKIYEYGNEWANTFQFEVTGIGGKEQTQAMTAPKKVNAVLASYNKVKLSWSKVPGAKSYNIYRKTGSGTYSKVKNVKGTSWTNSLLKAGKKYSYYVRPVKSTGTEGKKSTAVSVTTIGKVNGVSAVKGSSKKLKITWKKTSGASGYQISVSTSKNITKSQGTVSSSVLTKTVSATPGKTYYVKVRAFQKSGTKNIYGQWSEVSACKFPGSASKTDTTRMAASDASRKTAEICVEINEDHKTFSADYSDSFFAKSVVDDKKLIRISALAAASTYGDSSLAFLRSCGFSTNLGSKYTGNGQGTKTDNDHCTVYSGSKVASFKDGAGGSSYSKRIIGIVVSGYSDSDYEWISNFNLGKGDVHTGFEKAAQEAFEYIKKKFGTLDHSIIWIAGHSRGGAITNLLSQKIMKEYKNAEVFGYGFATPNSVKAKDTTNRVVNIVNDCDFVPYVPLGAWGFRKIGAKQYTFSINSEIKSEFKKLTGKKLNALSRADRERLILYFNMVCDKSQAGYYKTAVHYAREGLALAVIGEPSGVVKMLSYGGTRAPEYELLNGFFILNGTALNPEIMDAHRMETYLAYIAAN